jgi:hypothetical protein
VSLSNHERAHDFALRHAQGERLTASNDVKIFMLPVISVDG